MKGLTRMQLTSVRPDKRLIWKGAFQNDASLKRCSNEKCRRLTTGREKTLQTGKTRPLCQNCAINKGIADRGA